MNINSMQINHRSLQDLCLFGEPLHIPIIIVERMANMARPVGGNSFFNASDAKANDVLENGSRIVNKPSGTPQQTGNVLRVVVFVHGFQACFMLSCSCLYLLTLFWLLFLYFLLL